MAEFFLKAVAGGVLLAIIAACLGSVVQWRRMAFFSDALAHSALLGISLSLLLGINLFIGLTAVVVLLGVLLHGSANQQLPADSILAMFAYLSLGGGTLLLQLSGSDIKWEELLFGDILALSNLQLVLLVGATGVIAVGLRILWPTLLAIAINDEVAAVEDRRSKYANLLFTVLLCIYVAVGVRLVGVLLLNALLVIPAAAARNVAGSPAQMLLFASGIGSISIIAGIGTTYFWDVQAAPACVLFAGVAFAMTWALRSLRLPN